MLVGVFQQQKELGRQFEDSTSELSKLMGKTGYVSPIMADHFIRDASEVVKVGQKVQVTVVEVDLTRNRIALSMKSKVDLDNRRSTGDDRDARPNNGGGNRHQSGRTPNFSPNAAPNNDWFSQALNQAKKK